MTKIIEQPAWAVISGLLLCVLIYLIVDRPMFIQFIFDRLTFIQNSEEAVGTVIKIESYNSRCSGGSRYHCTYPCTKYTAHIKYPHSNGNYYTFKNKAGVCVGSDRPITCASSHVGESTDVIYDSNNPERAYPGTFAVWMYPLMFNFEFDLNWFF